MKQPEFIRYHLKEAYCLNLNKTEALLYGFIRFAKSSNEKKFYYSDKQLAEILFTTPKTINNAMRTLKKHGLVKTQRRIKANGGTIRFVEEVLFITNSMEEVLEKRKRCQESQLKKDTLNQSGS